MPFTPSHIAAVLPLRRVGIRLPLAALAAGSVSPDLPYYLPGLRSLGGPTHEPWAVISIDLFAGLALWALWRWIGPGLHDLAPASVRERWVLAGWRDAGAVPVVLALTLGATTHVLWDSFTHPGRWGTQLLPALQATWATPVGTLPGWQIAQHASGVFGLAVLVGAGTGQPRNPAPARRRTRVHIWAWPLIALAGILGALVAVLVTDASQQGWSGVAFAIATGSITAAGIAVVVACRMQVAACTRAGPGG